MYSPKLDVLNLLQQPTYQPGTEKSKDTYYSCLTYNRTVDVSDFQKHAKIPRLEFNVFAAVQLLLLIRVRLIHQIQVVTILCITELNLGSCIVILCISIHL